MNNSGWKQLASLNNERSYSSACKFEDKFIFLSGGYSDKYNVILYISISFYPNFPEKRT